MGLVQELYSWLNLIRENVTANDGEISVKEVRDHTFALVVDINNKNFCGRVTGWNEGSMDVEIIEVASGETKYWKNFSGPVGEAVEFLKEFELQMGIKRA